MRGQAIFYQNICRGVGLDEGSWSGAKRKVGRTNVGLVNREPR